MSMCSGSALHPPIREPQWGKAMGTHEFAPADAPRADELLRRREPQRPDGRLRVGDAQVLGHLREVGGSVARDGAAAGLHGLADGPAGALCAEGLAEGEVEVEGGAEEEGEEGGGGRGRGGEGEGGREGEELHDAGAEDWDEGEDEEGEEDGGGGDGKLHPAEERERGRSRVRGGRGSCTLAMVDRVPAS